MQKKDWGVVLFGVAELAIGTIALVAVLASLFLGRSAKPWEVLLFVLTTSITSASLGLGILKYNLTSYNLLLFFAKVIILTKAAIFLKIISLSGALETSIPAGTKNIISVIYHIILIWYLGRPKIRAYFGERRNTLSPWKPAFLKKLCKS